MEIEYTGDWYDLTVLDERARKTSSEPAMILFTKKAMWRRREEVQQPLIEWMGKLIAEMEGIGGCDSLPLMRQILASLEAGPDGVALLCENIENCWA